MTNNIHALIIDDDMLNLEVLARMLTNEGVGSTHLSDPVQLEATMDTLGQVDVVFLDLEMPNRDGYDVLPLLRQYLGSSVPVIAHTVHTNESQTAMDLGFDGMIAKPLSMARFPDQLNRILNGERVWEIQ